jgi:putative transcriptional regulator
MTPRRTTDLTLKGGGERSRLRKREGVSEAVFASSLNGTTGVVSKWERGDKRPHSPSLTLLSLVQKKGLEVIA